MKKAAICSTVVRVLEYISSRADWFESPLRYFMLFLPSNLPNGYQSSLKFRWFEWIQIWAPKTAAYYRSPIEIGVFCLEIKCLKSATRLLNRVCVSRRGLDCSKEVLWVSLCQKAAKLPAGKVGGLKKDSATWLGSGPTHTVDNNEPNFWDLG